MNINDKNDVIKWLKRLKDDHPLSVDECRLQNQNGNMAQKVKVYTDQVIKYRYQGMIDFLESDEVISLNQKDIGDRCVYCFKDTSFGSGRFVDRIPASTDDLDGYVCTECQQEVAQ